jgi:hypothetical protein
MHYNALEEMPTIKYRDPAEIRQEYPYIEQIFKNSSFSPEMVTEIEKVVDDCEGIPLVVRSSSLLEDLKGSAFAGKYKSLFVANQGSRKERVDALIDAILEVYASVFGPDPIEYRRDRGLLDFNEEMAIMIQEVVGQRVGKYFFPAYAGVAFSYNEFRMSPRIKRDDGIVRMVAGLGTRAVDRVSEDYPFFISPGQPGIRANISPIDRLRYSQKKIDVIDLETGRFETHDFATLVEEIGPEFPLLSSIISFYRDGHFHEPVGTALSIEEGVPVVSFHNLIGAGRFIPRLRLVLKLLEEQLGTPVDIEFACNGSDMLYLLQCRPQSQAAAAENISVPADIPLPDRLFTATRYVTAGEVRGIEYIVYVDPFGYESLETRAELLAVGRAIGALNSLLPHQKFVLIGPGRWGSRGDIKLGVSVGYADINNTAMLIEVARNKHGYVPELSFGTHFFQDLVESHIRYLPLYPDEQGNEFNESFFLESPNALAALVPEAEHLAPVVRVVSIAEAFPGCTATVVMDGDRNRALAYIDRRAGGRSV